MNINGIILLIIGILYIILGSWEASVNNKINTFDDSSNNVICVFIILRMLFNILWGCYCILLALLIICKTITRDNPLYLIDINYGCINFIIGIFGLVEYYNESNVFHTFKQVLFIEMIIFYCIYSVIIYILISYCCIMFCLVNSTINIIENTSVPINEVNNTDIIDDITNYNNDIDDKTNNV